MAYARIQVRFDQPGYAIYCNLESLLLKAANQENYSVELQKVISFYGNDFNESELSTQLQIFGTNFAREAQPSKITLQEAFIFCGLCTQAIFSTPTQNNVDGLGRRLVINHNRTPADLSKYLSSWEVSSEMKPDVF